jgi:hypothetical protein
MDHNDVEVARSLGSIEGKLDRVLENLLDQETRIRRLESKSAWMAGAAAAVGALGGVVWNIFFNHPTNRGNY